MLKIIKTMPKKSNVYYDKETKTYYSVASLGFDKITGKRMQKKKRGFKTQKEAKDWHTETMAKHSKRAITNGIKLTFKMFLDNYYIPHYEKTVSARTFYTFSSNLKRLAYFYDMKIVDIKPIHVGYWQTELLKEELSNTYVRLLHGTLVSILNFALKLEVIHENPATKLGNVSKKRQEVDFWTVEEFQTFISSFDLNKYKERLYYTAFTLFFMTGLRKSELQALTWQDIDFSDNSLMVNKSLYYKSKNDWIINPTKTKTGVRKIYLDKTTVKILSDWEKWQKVEDNDFVFSQKGSPMSSTSFQYMLKKHCMMVDVKPIRIHALRHSHASLLLALGMNDLELQNRLGHTNISTTLGTYSHLRPTAMKEVADKLNGILSIK